MKKNLLLSSLIIYLLITIHSTGVFAFSLPVENPFKDIPDDSWYTYEVLYANSRGAMTGKSSDTFDPKAPLTRAETVTLFYKLEGTPKVDITKQIFPDVSNNSWYGSAVIWAQKNNIVNGYTAGADKGKFIPKGNITRQQFIKIIYGYANYKGFSTAVSSPTSYKKVSDYTDVSGYAIESMNWGYENGFIGNGSNFNPKDNITRREAAVILTRFLEKYDHVMMKPTFSFKGSASNITGKTVIVTIAVNDSETTWNFSDSHDIEARKQYKTMLTSALNWIQNQVGKSYTKPEFIYDWNDDKDLYHHVDFSSNYLSNTTGDGNPSLDLYIEQYIDTVKLLNKYKADNIIYMFIYNTPSTNKKYSYSINSQKGGGKYEKVNTFVGFDSHIVPASLIARYILECFGNINLVERSDLKDYKNSLTNVNSKEIMVYASFGEKIYSELTNIDKYYLGLISAPAEIKNNKLPKSEDDKKISFDYRGTASDIKGKTLVISIYASDLSYKWNFSDSSQNKFANDIHDTMGYGYAWLTDQLKNYGANNAEFIYDWYKYSDLLYACSFNKDVIKDVTKNIGEEYYYIDNYIDTAGLLKKYNADNIIYIFIFNTPSTFTIRSSAMGRKLSLSEYEIINITAQHNETKVNATTFPHETLHLFGAPDFYYSNIIIPQSYVDYLDSIQSKDVMRYASSGNKVNAIFTDTDAYYCGLLNTCNDLKKWSLGLSEYQLKYYNK